MAKSLSQWKAEGYFVGAIVEQPIGGTLRKDRAVITYVDPCGALDVEIDGKAYGWSASRCTPVQNDDNGKAGA